MDLKVLNQEVSTRFALYHGDSVEVLAGMPDESVGYMISSPPFASLYTYSNSERDLGNCRTREEFFEHYRFIAAQLYRLLKPGRCLSFHCMNLPSTKERDGFIGIHDFRGELIRAHQSDGFIFHSEVCIWKDPVTAMQRTKAIGLLYKQLRKDSCISRQGIPDYLVTMRKPGENPDRVTKTHESFPVGQWQKYASPVWEMGGESLSLFDFIEPHIYESLSDVAKMEVLRMVQHHAERIVLNSSPTWMDINPSDTLQRESAREDNDERHICPLQLGVIERGIDLWSNPNDVVLSPFAGIGSEGYVAIKQKRRFIGVELKESYYKQACLNLRRAEREGEQDTLFHRMTDAELAVLGEQDEAKELALVLTTIKPDAPLNLSDEEMGESWK